MFRYYNWNQTNYEIVSRNSQAFRTNSTLNFKSNSPIRQSIFILFYRIYKTYLTGYSVQFSLILQSSLFKCRSHIQPSLNGYFVCTYMSRSNIFRQLIFGLLTLDSNVIILILDQFPPPIRTLLWKKGEGRGLVSKNFINISEYLLRIRLIKVPSH